MSAERSPRTSARIPIWIYLAGLIPLCVFLILSAASSSITRFTQYTSAFGQDEQSTRTQLSEKQPNIARQQPAQSKTANSSSDSESTVPISEPQSKSSTADDSNKRSSADIAVVIQPSLDQPRRKCSLWSH
eukprot:IDg16546t1